jgi:hypothetical protein
MRSNREWVEEMKRMKRLRGGLLGVRNSSSGSSREKLFLFFAISSSSSFFFGNVNSSPSRYEGGKRERERKRGMGSEWNGKLKDSKRLPLLAYKQQHPTMLTKANERKGERN